MDNQATPNNNAVTDGTVTASGFQVSLPMGGMTIVAGYAQDDVAATGGTTTGVELSMALVAVLFQLVHLTLTKPSSSRHQRLRC